MTYVDSGVEWLGEVPGHWEVVPLKHWAEVLLSNIDKHSLDGQPPVRLCNYMDVYKNEVIDDSIEFMLATASPEQIERLTVKPGDLIVTKDSESPSDIAVPAYVDMDIKGLVCGYHLAIISQTIYKMEVLLAEANRAITLLKERRNALISAAVTGQIDVRGLA
jgi:type I restriction enzyme S subunit